MKFLKYSNLGSLRRFVLAFLQQDNSEFWLVVFVKLKWIMDYGSLILKRLFKGSPNSQVYFKKILFDMMGDEDGYGVVIKAYD